MDLFERIFGISPDGGNGSLELLYLVSIAAAITLIVYVYALSHRRKQASAHELLLKSLPWIRSRDTDPRQRVP